MRWNIIGHKKVISILKKQIDRDLLHHAYIFIGPESVGKNTLAIEFAKNIICGCGRCAICKKVENLSYPDLAVISPKKAKKSSKISISIKNIRDLKRKFSLSSHSNSYKIGIIKKVEYLGAEAANSLLKLLEEPPKKTILILTSVAESAVLETILSRCQKLYLQAVSRRDIKQKLILMEIDKNQAQLLSEMSSGKPGRAIRLTREERMENFKQNLKKLEDIFKKKNYQNIEDVANLIKQKANISQILDDWLFILSVLLNQKLGNYKYQTIKFDTLNRLDNKQIVAMIRKSLHLKRLLQQNANPKLVIENLVFGMKEER